MTNDDVRDDPDHDLEALLRALSTLHGRPVDPAKLTGPLLLAYRRLLVRGIRSKFAPQSDMDDTFEEMRVAAPLLRIAGMPQPGIKILAPSFSGKSVGALDYVKRVRARLGQSSSSAVYVKLDSEGSVGSLATDILRALGEPRPESLTPEKRWARARRRVREREVDLLILDEFQRAGRRLTIHPVIAQKIFDIMDPDEGRGGDAAVAFVGKLDAKKIFKATEDLPNRLDAPVSIGRLRWLTHSLEFMAFARDFDAALQRSGITSGPANLSDPAIAELLLESARGLIGQFTRIIETAVINITRDGRTLITRQDLSDAVQDWCIGNERIAYNPFEEGSMREDATSNAGKGKAGKTRAGKTKEEDGISEQGADDRFGAHESADMDDDDEGTRNVHSEEDADA